MQTPPPRCKIISMVILIVENSTSNISGLSIDMMGALRTTLSYIDESSRFSYRRQPTRKYLIDKKGYFPTGLLRYVIEHLTAYSIAYEFRDNRVKPRLRAGLCQLSLPFDPYPDQMDAAAACERCRRGCVSAPTGTGKSLMMALAINKLQVPTLVVVPNLELKRQLLETFRSIFPANIVGGSLRTWHPITVENVDALSTTTMLKDIDCVIIDESHHSASRTYRTLNQKCWGGVYYRLFFTATAYRSRSEEQLLMESVSGQVIHRLEHRKAVSKGYIVPIEAYTIDIPKTKTDGDNYVLVYKDLVVNNQVRNDIIASTLMNLQRAAPTLCLVREIAHGEALSALTGVPFANGKNENCGELIRQFNSGEIKGLIGTTGVLGEGIDTKPAEYVLIAGLGKSRNSFVQQCGRAFRNYPGKTSAKVILFKDPTHKWTLQHYKAQVKYLKEEYGVIPEVLK